ncbi:MAG: PaaX family transcriptional regulator C-terminal domain-containing protein [Pseudomonadota bacterium]
MPSDPYQDAIARLTALGPLRVWSLLVTVFGDLAPDAALDGPTLSAIMAEIGIKPEASRVALHRLRADGWIISEKNGRTSRHRLSPKGRAGSDAARPRIYPDSTGVQAVQFALMPNGQTPDSAHYAQVSPRLFVASAEAMPPEGALMLAADQLPDWLETTVETEALRAEYAALHDALAHMRLPDADTLGPLRVAVLRVLIVHAWRRLVLRHPALPRALHSDQWRGHDCAARVRDLLDHLPRPALTDI